MLTHNASMLNYDTIDGQSSWEYAVKMLNKPGEHEHGPVITSMNWLGYGSSISFHVCT